MSDNTLTLAKQLIAIPSTADDRKALADALDVVAAYIAKHDGITIERFESGEKPSLLAYHGDSRPGQFRVLLNGHVDVVPGNKDQFFPKLKTGKLYGRGACDMKVAALTLAEVFCKLASALPYPLGLQIVTDEEIGGANGTLYQLDQGVKTEFAIAGEFTPAGAICNESRGICWAEIEFSGTTAHSAYLWNGKNAILTAHDFIARLTEAYPVPSSDVWQTTANVATFSTPNQTLNRVPDKAIVGIDIRYVAEDTRFGSKDAALQFLQSLTSNATVNIKMFEPSHYADPDNPYVKKLSAAVEKTVGNAHFICKHGAADIRYFSERGIPAVVLGLEGEGLHGDDEYVLIDSIPRYRDTLTKFLKDLSY